MTYLKCYASEDRRRLAQALVELEAEGKIAIRY